MWIYVYNLWSIILILIHVIQLLYCEHMLKFSLHLATLFIIRTCQTECFMCIICTPVVLVVCPVHHLYSSSTSSCWRFMFSSCSGASHACQRSCYFSFLVLKWIWEWGIIIINQTCTFLFLYKPMWAQMECFNNICLHLFAETTCHEANFLLRWSSCGDDLLATIICLQCCCNDLLAASFFLLVYVTILSNNLG